MRDAFSSLAKLSGSMPHGSLLGPITFIVLIDDLSLPPVAWPISLLMTLHFLNLSKRGNPVAWI